MALLTDATLNDIHSVLQTRKANLQRLVDATTPSAWKQVQDDVKRGLGTKYAIGTELTCKCRYNNTDYDFPWVVSDNNRTVYWEDGSAHPGIILLAKYATIESIQLDAAEATTVDSSTETTAQDGWYYWGKTGSTYTALNLSTGDTIPFGDYDSVQKCGINNLDVLRYGYNRYRDSAYRQWLNSIMPKNYWWESTHLGDVAPSQLSTVDGFMLGLDSDFLQVINPVKVQVAANTVTDGGVTDVMYDKFWLPSIEEMYGVPQKAGVEGEYLPYVKAITGLENPSNDANAGRIAYALENHKSAQLVRLRSAVRGSTHHAWVVTNTGQVTSHGADGAIRSRPACAIS